jgi:Flp pilus assembly protein TadB
MRWHCLQTTRSISTPAMLHSSPILVQTAPVTGTSSRQASPDPKAKSSGPHWENLVYIGLAVGGFILAILLFRWAIRISKWVFMAVLFVAGSIWVAFTLYHRTEPKFLTPVFDVLAQWLPTKDYVAPDPAKAAQEPKRK